jgi:N6-L-threonylcarbamoyladenine synthase
LICLGIDTSNYTSSAALAGADGVLEDVRKQLPVKSGGRGLRQSEAFFYHVDNIPALAGPLLREYRGLIGAVAVSDKPRPVPGAYMPVFRAGLRFAEAFAEALGTPLFCFSHQEGHIRAAMQGTDLNSDELFLAWHISGGTSELLLAESGGAKLSIVGGSKDISFGQLIDRVGVALGMDFPAGARLDSLASETYNKDADEIKLTRIHRDGLFFNLSGTETQALRAAADGAPAAALSRAVFEDIADCLLNVGAEAARAYGVKEILFTGGVSASGFLRKRLQTAEIAPKHFFGNAALSGDNAVGVALLGVDKLWL